MHFHALRNGVQRLLIQQAESGLGLSPLHKGLLVALQQDQWYCVTGWQSWGYHSHATDLAAERAPPDRSANVGETPGTRAAPSYPPARRYDMPAQSSGPRSGPYQSQRPHQRPYPGSDRGQSFRPPYRHPQARAHAQDEHLEPWEDRRTRLNSLRQQPSWRSTSGEPSGSARRAEQPEVAPPGLLASRSPAFGSIPEHRARPGAHESAARSPHDTDRGTFRQTSDLPQQQLSAQAHQEHPVARVHEPQRMEEPIPELPDGNPQPYILWQADEACRHASKAAAEEFIARMAEVLDKRSDSLTRTNISTVFHRCAKVMNATIQAELARTPHMEERIADIPAIVPFLERLTALALPLVHILDPMSVSNIFWALGTLRLSPGGGKLVEALLKRGIALAESGVYPMPVGIAHVFWACANLHTSTRQHGHGDLCNQLLETFARHLIDLEVDEVRMKAIDYTHLFWACGVMHIDPCNGLMLAKLAHGVTAIAHQFSVQGCTNVLWGLARQDAKRMQLITGKGHLFKAMAGRLVQQANRLLPSEGLPVNFSMLIWSLGTLNYHPGQPFFQNLVSTIIRKGMVDEFNAQNLCNLIWGMARLAEHPGPELMGKFRQKSEELLDARTDPEDEEEKGQGVANTLWALAVLDELRPEFAEQAYEKLADKLSPRSHTQLFQTHLYLEAALPQGKAPRLPLRLHNTCRDAWRKSKEWVTVSQLQKAIHRGLREAGLDVQMEYNEGLFSVDLALFLPPSRPGGDRRKVAIECDGICHYSCNRPLVDGRQHHMPTGRTLMRNKLLRARGWHVVDVPWFEWNALDNTKEARSSYLAAAIALELQNSKTHKGLRAA